MFLTDLVSALLSPVHVVGRRLYSRVARAFSFRAVGRRRYRPKRDFTLPVIEYSQVSSLYFAIEQATYDDKVGDDFDATSSCIPLPGLNPHQSDVSGSYIIISACCNIG